MSSFLSGFGLLAFFSLLSRALLPVQEPGVGIPVGNHPGGKVRFLAVGDVNLGRSVGQEILRGDTLFPFVFVRDTFLTYDIVFGNLESQLSDQKGETQDPKNNLIFTGPPEGGWTLMKGGMTVVSTANNHAFDYGRRGHSETIQNLSEAGVMFCGTSREDSLLYEPVVLTREGIRFAFFACTDVMNMEGDGWRQFVAAADSSRLFPRMRAYRKSADFIVLSYHGGNEYANRPTERTRNFAKAALRAGADLFLGHHPHVPQGIEEVDGKFILYSLGNFVFRQPFQTWTQKSFAFSATIEKSGPHTMIVDAECLPVLTGIQPKFVGRGPESETIIAHIKSLSRAPEKIPVWSE